MKKIIILLVYVLVVILISMMFASCHASFTPDDPFVVEQIDYYSEGKCTYYPVIGKPVTWYCGLANVGDTLWLTTTNPYN